ncbi:putative nuclease HARBI1 [Anthonomus grandis grandis]|uniref:putative nuclease HARBI1 n=1 Tax=Anthonomus grandis grandis TaxID=2921223 RepID=UPI0021665A8D|nr:putative nuclease HARBI1 [Anthonomus grandis grandis]
MSVTSDDLCLMAVISIICVKKNKKKDQVLKKKTIRSKWVKSWLMKRSNYSHINLLEELRLSPDDFRNYLHMDEDTYVELLTMVTPLIKKQDSRMRKFISPHERLSATLRFLATGRSFEDLKYTALISPQALGKIIPETCKAICKVLHIQYIKFPNSEKEWLAIADEFFTKWNFPCCLGAVDGKHVKINCPPKSGSFFYNYKGYFSIVLMAIVNANYEFILVDIGTNGRVSVGEVIESTRFYEKLKTNALKIPSPIKSFNNSEELPFVFIGDEAFALLPNFMKPFNIKVLDNEKKVFNYRLSRARNVVENAFGILASRFRNYIT